MDTFSQILDSLRFDGTFYFATNFNPPWSIRVPSYKRVARFHYVTQGHCWVDIPNMDSPQKLSAGDIIIIPHGKDHILSDLPGSTPVDLDDAMEKSNFEPGKIFHYGSETSVHDAQLVCGNFEFNDEYKHPFIDSLPHYIIRNENDGADFSWLKDSLHFMSHNAKESFLGSSAIIKRLSEIIFIQSVRLWYENQNSQEGFLAALNDAHISKALQAFHNDYAANWSVEKLANIAGMSRSLFSERFKRYLNLSPMQYVSQCRMENAKRLLRESDLSLEKIAHTIGYETLASFSKAFKRIININPGEYRREL